jgi:AraC-like DNA-binding protein
LQYGVPGVPDALSRQHNEYTTFLLGKRFLSMLDDARIDRLWFTNARPKDVNRLVAEFGTQSLGFDQPLSGFAFDAALLDAPAKTSDAALFAFLEEHALAALASRPKTDDLIDRLRHSIREALKHGEPNIERIATRLALSGRTLQRRLSDLETSFQSVLDDVRFDLARAYLRDVRIDITQVAYLLGYSELRAFDRAFKRWANTTPREWRDGSGKTA